MESSEDLLKRAGDILVEKGFATSYKVDFTKGTTTIQWTLQGVSLREKLRKLFGVPARDSEDVPLNDIYAVVMLIID